MRYDNIANTTYLQKSNAACNSAACLAVLAPGGVAVIVGAPAPDIYSNQFLDEKESDY